MESNLPLTVTNQKLNQYVFHMESEIGNSGRTFHEILSGYLELKARNPALANEVEDLMIESPELITPAQWGEYLKHLRRLKSLRKKVFQVSKNPGEHPWQSFAHPDHQLDEFETLLRTLRFVSIQLNKFWIEVQSFPLFMNVLGNASLIELERIFRWLLTNPNWNEIVYQSRVIPALTQIDSRRVLLDFARDVKSVKILHEKLVLRENRKFLEPGMMQMGLSLLATGLDLAQKYGMRNSTRNDLDTRLIQVQENLNKTTQIRTFFQGLAAQANLPCPKNLKEVKQLDCAANCIRQIPTSVLVWRIPSILAAGQLIRIEAWRDRARPILEARKKVEAHFCLEKETDSEKLRNLASQLSEGGVFRNFKTSYQESMDVYRRLLKTAPKDKSKIRDSQTQISERLIEWAVYLDQVRAFENNAEVRKAFGPLFRGIDTDFSVACLANTWASQLRIDLMSEVDSFGKLLVEFIFGAAESDLKAVISNITDMQMKDLGVYRDESQVDGERAFEDLIGEYQNQQVDLKRLLNVLMQLGIQPEVPLSSLEELQTMTEEVLFLCNRMDSNGDLKQWLKSAYRGPDTDLAVIEQGLAYVQYIEYAEIPDSLKTVFLSVYGPQRLSENRTLVGSTWTSLEGIKELLQKLEICSHRVAKRLGEVPLPALLGRIQLALKQPTLLGDWVEYLRCEREVRGEGLGLILDFYEKKGLFNWEIDVVFELALNASLLKQAISQNNEKILGEQNSVSIQPSMEVLSPQPQGILPPSFSHLGIPAEAYIKPLTANSETQMQAK